jgi:hypothetical protein
MIKNWLKPWLRACAVVCAIASAVFNLFFLAPNVYADCSMPINGTLNYGAVEAGATFTALIRLNLQNCATEISGFNVTGPNSSEITFNNPPSGKGCIGFVWTGTQPQDCFFDVNFSPATAGALAVVVAPVTNDQFAPPEISLFGAGFTLSPETHDLDQKGRTVDAFPLMYESPPSPGFGSIAFDPGNAEITWSGKLDYQSSGHDPRRPASIPIATFTPAQAPYTVGFGTPGAEPMPNMSKLIAGGQLTLKATYNPNGNDSITNTIIGYVTGILLPLNSTAITNQLTTLYPAVSNPAPTGSITPGLMTQVAMVESNYQQFFNPTTAAKAPYGVFSPSPATGPPPTWPKESPKSGKGAKHKAFAGGHIGLFQVPVTQIDAWNWLQNAADGVTTGPNSFQSKINVAVKFANALQGSVSPAPPNLTKCQLEEMALELFGPYSGGTIISSQTIAKQYYKVVCMGGTGTNCTGGSWQWAINTDKNLCGVCYVTDLRSKVPPGGSASSCNTTPPTNPAPDPPTNPDNGNCKITCPNS